MNAEVNGVRVLLRTLAEVRDGPFYTLWVELTHRLKRLTPQIGFRISQVADCEDACLGVGVSATREDGLELDWYVGLTTSPDNLQVTGAIAITDDTGSREVFTRSAAAANPQLAADLVRNYAAEVCAQLHWFDKPEVG